MGSIIFTMLKDGDYYVASSYGVLGGPYDTQEQADEAATDFASAGYLAEEEGAKDG